MAGMVFKQGGMGGVSRVCVLLHTYTHRQSRRRGGVWRDFTADL